MSVFSDKELAYLADRRLGRLATLDADALPHVVPLGRAARRHVQAGR